MADHGSQLMIEINRVLVEQVPLAGGWHAARQKKPSFPVGYIDLTMSDPQRGQGSYMERHTGVISIWTRGSDTRPPDPYPVMQLSEAAHRLLGAAVLSTPELIVMQFQCGALVPQNSGGPDWGRVFTFSAITYEVSQNG